MRKGNAGGGANLGINEKSYNDAYDINLSLGMMVVLIFKIHL